jgi:SAM-dependent methyltransferase
VRFENLEGMTFADESIDLHITQDVMEHVLDPDLVFKEVARTLKPGGAHIFTVPIVNKHHPSDRRALLKGGRIVHLREPVYHGNPVDNNGALVTFDWGFDICEHIFKASGLYTHIVNMDDVSHGIRAEYIEVLVTIKPQKAG